MSTGAHGPFEREARICQTMLGYANWLLREIPAEQFDLQPLAGVNTPGWIVGHLALAADWGLAQLDAATLCPPAWEQYFGLGSGPPRPAQAPERAELTAALARGYDALITAARGADPAPLERPHDFPPLQRGAIRSVADLLAHLLTSHPALHVGQLTYWRRAMGHPRLF